MPLLLLRQDITKVKADIIVNTTNTKLLQGSGTSRAIFLAAGEEELTKACEKIGGCEIGSAVITPAFKLQAKYIIHAVGPIWMNETADEINLLYSAYESSLKLAKKYNAETIAFPLISAGNYKMPIDIALGTAVNAINDFLADNDMTVYLTIYEKRVLEVGQKLSLDVQEYIDDNYVSNNDESYDEIYDVRMEDALQQKKQSAELDVKSGQKTEPTVKSGQKTGLPVNLKPKTELTLEEQLNGKVETFTEMLFRLIDERNMSDVEVYRKANIDRKLFSKIRSNVDYKPSKKTIICLIIALELSVEEANELLMKAGYTLSTASKFDVVVSYYLEKKIYNIMEINEVLFKYELPLLG